MDLTPRDIQQKQFADTFRGYSHEEVDAFLDEVAESFSRIYRENQNLVARLRNVEQDLASAKQTEDMLKRTLLQAQKTVDDTIAEAKRKAQEIQGEAASRASAIVAESQAKQIEIRGTIESLRRYEREYRERLKAFMDAQLKVLGGPSVAPSGEPAPPPPSVGAESVPSAETSTQMPAGQMPAGVRGPEAVPAEPAAAPVMPSPSMIDQTSAAAGMAGSSRRASVGAASSEDTMGPDMDEQVAAQPAAASTSSGTSAEVGTSEAPAAPGAPTGYGEEGGAGHVTAGSEPPEPDDAALRSAVPSMGGEAQPDYPSPAPEAIEKAPPNAEPEKPRVKEDEKSISELFWGEE